MYKYEDYVELTNLFKINKKKLKRKSFLGRFFSLPLIHASIFVMIILIKLPPACGHGDHELVIYSIGVLTKLI